MAGGGHIIIKNSVVATAKLGTVSDNLTPNECKDRDALCAKSNLTVKEIKDLNAIIVKAYGRLV